MAFINQHIAKHGEGLHHLGLAVDDLAGFIAQTKARGYKIPWRDQFSNRDEVVLRPRDAHSVVLRPALERRQRRHRAGPHPARPDPPEPA